MSIEMCVFTYGVKLLSEVEPVSFFPIVPNLHEDMWEVGSLFKSTRAQLTGQLHKIMESSITAKRHML